MNYGKIHITETYIGGALTKRLIRYEEEELATTPQQVFEAMDDLNRRKDRGEILDPGVNTVSGKDGKLKRVVKSWTDPESKLF